MIQRDDRSEKAWGIVWLVRVLNRNFLVRLLSFFNWGGCTSISLNLSLHGGLSWDEDLVWRQEGILRFAWDDTLRKYLIILTYLREGKRIQRHLRFRNLKLIFLSLLFRFFHHRLCSGYECGVVGLTCLVRLRRQSFSKLLEIEGSWIRVLLNDSTLLERGCTLLLLAGSLRWRGFEILRLNFLILFPCSLGRLWSRHPRRTSAVRFTVVHLDALPGSLSRLIDSLSSLIGVRDGLLVRDLLDLALLAAWLRGGRLRRGDLASGHLCCRRLARWLMSWGKYRLPFS